MADVSVGRDDERSRYSALVGGEPAGFAQYQLTDDLIVFTHTEVDPGFEGLGVGSAIVRFALDDVRAGGTRRILPLCPFVKAWLGKHAEYADLVYGAPAPSVSD